MATSSIGQLIRLNEENAQLVLDILNAKSEKQAESIREQAVEKFKLETLIADSHSTEMDG